MSDLISREAAIDALAEMYCKSDEDGYVWIIRGDACLRIDALPSVDAVEVVRCKDCRWWERDYQPRYHSDERPCNRVGMGTPPDWFCADNERRDDER